MHHSFLLLVVPIIAILSFQTSIAMVPSQTIVESRLRGALWGLFSGDALASPTHWYYGGFPQIQSDYGRGGITGYTKPVLNLSGSILNKSDPNGGGRLSYSGKGGAVKSIIGDVINHGKLKYWDPKKSYHYHATLQAGENTLESQLARVLMKSIVANNGSFNEDHFRKAYIDFMTTEGSHNDTYASTCHRMFFANLIFKQLNPKDCPDNDGHNVDTIDGLILPTVTSLAETARQLVLAGDNRLTAEGKEKIERSAARTAAVTRSSDVLEKVSEVWADLVASAVTASSDGSDRNEMEQPLIEMSKQLGFRRSPQPNAKDQMT
jgi:ADP-ribosylglycohydrolase